MYPFKKVFDTLTVIVQQIDNVQRREGSRRDFETFFSNLTNSAQTFPLSFLPCFAINQALFLSFFLFSVQQSECLPEKKASNIPIYLAFYGRIYFALPKSKEGGLLVFEVAPAF